MVYHQKGERRVQLDSQRRAYGEPNNNWKKNRESNCRFPKGGVASRKKGPNRFKTGKKAR